MLLRATSQTGPTTGTHRLTVSGRAVDTDSSDTATFEMAVRDGCYCRAMIALKSAAWSSNDSPLTSGASTLRARGSGSRAMPSGPAIAAAPSSTARVA